MSQSPTREQIRARYAGVDTANVADVLDDLGLHDQGLAAGLHDLGGARLAGFAYTIAGENARSETSGDPAKMQACGGVGEGEVTVWSGAAEGVCYFGELIALGMMERGSVGAVVDSGVRDLAWLREHGFPVFARYRTPIQSIGRWRVTDWQVPVAMPGATVPEVTVHPGDFVLGDDDGVLVVPAERVVGVLEAAERMTATEARVRRALREGATLTEALERFGHV